MASLVSGIFDLAEGNPTQQEQGQLGDLGTFVTNTGEGAVNAAQGYYGGILSGNPEDIAKTLAPEISAGAQQVQQQAATNAQFGNRGGGTNASTQGAQSNERGNIINLIGQEQQNAAGAEAGLGTNLLSQATGNITSEAGLAAANQQRQTADVGGIAQGAAEIASGVAGGFAGGGGAGMDPETFGSLMNASTIPDQGAGGGNAGLDLSSLE